jgi:hypothetical protein
MIHPAEVLPHELPLPTLFEQGPLFELRAQSGCLTVAADDETLARGTLRAAECVLPEVAGALGLPPEPVWVEVETSEEEICRGLAGLGRVLLTLRRPEPELRFVLAGQLAVVLMQGTRWHRLPPIVFEGVSDLVAERLQPEAGPRRRLDHAGYLSIALLGELRLGLTPEDPDLAPLVDDAPMMRGLFPKVRAALEMGNDVLQFWPDPPTRLALSGLGYLLARRAGLGRLGALCADAEREGAERVGAEQVLLEARLSNGGRDEWSGAIRDLVGEREVAMVARRLFEEGLGDRRDERDA